MADDTSPAETDADVKTQNSKPKSAAGSPARADVPRSLVLRSWPKVVLMLPTLVMALVCTIVMAVIGDSSQEFGARHVIGLVFLLVLGINLTMLLYDLNLRGFIIVVLLFVVLLLLLFLVGRGGEAQEERIWSRIAGLFSVKVYANHQFYFVLSLILIFNLAIAWVITRFNYWKIGHNEIIIHKGFMQEQERHPTAQARFKLQIEDVVEYAMLGVGKLVFYFGDDDTRHEMPTVLFVHKKAKKLDYLLGRVEVVSHQGTG